MKRIFIGDGPTDVPNMSKTFCHLVRLGTRNLIDVFSKVFTESCLLFDKLTCVRIEKNQLSAAPSACVFQKVSLRSILAATNFR